MFLDRIKELLSERLNLDYDSLHDDSRFDELGADSIDIVELVMALEADLGVQLPDDQLERVSTLGELARLAEEY
ncbi:MAG: acyl carrier protein [Clostridia bacterium]|nr:acyl carrier protein [Clostridia bacterium]